MPPTFSGPEGIRFDFNDGARIAFPKSDIPWRVRLRDRETETVLADMPLNEGTLHSTRRSFVKFGFEIWRGGQKIFAHDLDLRDRDVRIDMSLGALGDHLAWIGQVECFRLEHQCRLTCVMKAPLAALLRDAYPFIRMVTPDAEDGTLYYASYKVCVFYNDENGIYQPVDYRLAGLTGTAAHILGQAPREIRPRLSDIASTPPLDEPYVCIATQVSGQAKYWNNPHGWREVVAFLKQQGLRVVCIDQKPVAGHGIVWNSIPNGVEDQTGNRPLAERAMWLKHARFFVGLSSGLSWLAWAVNCPVVMISGFTQPFNEFTTPWRPINRNVCHGCANDPRHQMDPKDYLWCPRHRGTPRQFECTRAIEGQHVIDMIGTLMTEIS
ncbi:autotransporter strand-loop-strand O-heptosyltransferase [Gluconobacter oxydans]|uniref:Autotransporter strand-loop-strand O-heptosyltransferase n=1 Tax=Gluconobacter oxydans TaxID=442 RepID=A0AB35AKW2_GLUOY|nr:autotransporter strand-loop-strand O-heptosyltransferase [Gluconobacter oxydans]KXV30840.1 glycosyltransferase [Gluconobacter oxydans]MBF0855598.1 autotransporter strand-loop-strand O-heptosyltransferase [Gluconobacter oxydans]